MHRYIEVYTDRRCGEHHGMYVDIYMYVGEYIRMCIQTCMYICRCMQIGVKPIVCMYTFICIWVNRYVFESRHA